MFMQVSLIKLFMGILILSLSAELYASCSATSDSQTMRVLWGMSARQGLRERMEDAVIYTRIRGKTVPLEVELCGLFDGHGGDTAAHFGAQYSPTIFYDSYHTVYAEGVDSEDLMAEAHALFFQVLDTMMRAQSRISGTAALVGVIHKNVLSVSWAGDSRAVVADKYGKIKLVTLDHKPNEPFEKVRIERAGGTVYREKGVWRFSGMSLSRSLGDAAVKYRVPPDTLTHMPDYLTISLEEGDIVVLACDGIWDVLSTSEVLELVQLSRSLDIDRLKKLFPGTHEKDEFVHEKPADFPGEPAGDHALTLIARGVRDLAHKKGSSDNLTVMILAFGAFSEPVVGKAGLKNGHSVDNGFR
jgi:serine/threonine protein phosphatase PrpC